MARTEHAQAGRVVSIWRYPVKSMMGEELNASEVTQHGLAGDRAYALVDKSDGKVATAKNPRKWPRMFDFRAALADVRGAGAKPPVRITLPDGAVVHSGDSDIHGVLSKALDREVTLSPALDLQALTAEAYWPDMDELDRRDTVTDFHMADGTFFDSAFVHLLTTSTLNRLRALYPVGRFETRRFRPNIVLNTTNGEDSFVEDSWIGKTLAIGDAVRLSITGHCSRCVMTTLAQGDLANEPGILRTAARHNRGNVGVYASVLAGGVVRRGDAARLE